MGRETLLHLKRVDSKQSKQANTPPAVIVMMNKKNFDDNIISFK